MIEDVFSKKDDELYRRNVGIVLQNTEKMIFVGRRLGSSLNSWQLPQGGMMEDETEEECLDREVREEIGILPNLFHVVQKSVDYHYYEIPKKMRKSIWNNIYVGQKQRWFLADFKGIDEDININTEFPEFDEWRWFTPERVIENVISFKKDIYIDILKEFNLLDESF